MHKMCIRISTYWHQISIIFASFTSWEKENSKMELPDSYSLIHSRSQNKGIFMRRHVLFKARFLIKLFDPHRPQGIKRPHFCRRICTITLKSLI